MSAERPICLTHCAGCAEAEAEDRESQQQRRRQNLAAVAPDPQACQID